MFKVGDTVVVHTNDVYDHQYSYFPTLPCVGVVERVFRRGDFYHVRTDTMSQDVMHTQLLPHEKINLTELI